MHDALIIGAGPAGLACAIEAAKKGLDYLLIDKGCLVNSVYNFPADMVFFTTPDLLQIGELVFVSQSFRPNRMEALRYYRAVASYYGINLSPYDEVTGIERGEEGFTVHSLKASGQKVSRKTKKVIVATGYYDNPNMLGIEGEDLPKVSHYYFEAHPYHDCDVAIIGAKNSAVEAALLLSREGARVTMIHRGPGISDSVKYWVRPDIDKKLENGKVKAMFNSQITKITPSAIEVECKGEMTSIKNDFVFALTGYRPDVELLRNAGVNVDAETLAPEYNAQTLETNVAGLYVAGSIVAGINNNKVFIENSREHGKVILG